MLSSANSGADGSFLGAEAIILMALFWTKLSDAQYVG